MNLPSANVIPDKLINAKVYMEGSSALLGVADIELPSLEYVTESMSGLGIAGERDTPVIGHFKAISLKLKWNTVNENAVTLLAPKTHQLDVAGRRAEVRRRERRVRHRRREAGGPHRPQEEIRRRQGRTGQENGFGDTSLKSTTSSSLRAARNWWRSTS